MQSIFLITVLQLIYGCSGGGGSSGSDQGAVAGVTYTGNPSAAAISPTNAAILVDAVIGTGDTSQVFTASFDDQPGAKTSAVLSAKNTSSIILLTRTLNRYLDRLPSETNQNTPNRRITASAVNVNETEPCDSGSVVMTGTLSDSGTGVLNLAFRNCEFDGTVANGVSTFQVISFDSQLEIPTESRFEFKNLRVTSSDVDATLHGALQYVISLIGIQETITFDVITQDHISGDVYKAENFKISSRYNAVTFPDSASQTISGRLFHSAHGYVDVTTPTPLISDTEMEALFYDNDFANEWQSGSLLFRGAENRAILLRFQPSSILILELDVDGNGVYEITATLLQDEIATSINSDLSDADGDGMHNSWETVYGLDPLNPADRELDSDSDGGNNYFEYVYGKNPRNANSSPPFADLSVAIRTRPVMPSVNNQFDYSLDLQNLGPEDATNVTLDASFDTAAISNFVAPIGGRGECSLDTNTLHCSGGFLRQGGEHKVLFITQAPAVTGEISITATISADEADRDPANSMVTHVTEIIPPKADLSVAQDAIPAVLPFGIEHTTVIEVNNFGPETADNVVLSYMVPAGTTFVSGNYKDFFNISGNQGNCSGGSIVICEMGSIRDFGRFSASITILPTTQGNSSSVATVTGDVFDFNEDNNTSSIDFGIFPSVVDIQSAIDSAAPGDTVTVAPGAYYGTLDFRGKDIQLISSDGPETTVLNGNQDKAVIIGPKGEINGFTITGGDFLFGAAIDVSGAETVISNNIFEGNIAQAVEYGAAIRGSATSPRIENNIFRNNDCDNQVQLNTNILFFNDNSSPVIINNLFENNSCSAITIALISGTSPSINNNTFVNNQVGIRIIEINLSTGGSYTNNIVVDNENGVIISGPPTLEIPGWKHNLVFANSPNYIGIGDQAGFNGNISADPLFIDPTTGNYRLSPGSPGIDSGTNTDAPTQDFDGNARPIDGDGNGTVVTDIGAFEAL